jgi:tetratricopeptide (TPR) repeat protein
MKKVTLLLAALLVFTAVSLSAQNAQTRLDNGKQLFDQGNYDGAIRELDEAIRLDPNMAEAYAYRARSYNAKENYDRSLADANKAIQLNPRLAMGYYARGNYYRDKNDNDRAIADYTEAIRLDPRFINAYINRALLYSGKKDYDRTIADYTEAIRLDPRLAMAYNNRGVAYDQKKDYDRAIADFNEAIRLDPRYANAYNNRGNSYYHKNDFDRAIADYEAALKIDPNHSLAKKNLEVAGSAKRNSFDRSKFTVAPSDFKPSEYTKVDLFKAVSDSRNLQMVSNKAEAVYGQFQSAFTGGMAGSYILNYVSDLTFVSQNGTDISFTSDDKAISQRMSIDQRSGLQAGQRVRVYYTVMRAPLMTWDVIAIERR